MDDVVLVAGARPNFMKVAPILHELVRRGELRPTLVHTGQHDSREMAGVFFEQLGLPAPAAHLACGARAPTIVRAFGDYLARRSSPPLGVVVVGDVTSTMACALAAANDRVPVVHVEAGLRSFDRSMPEEIHRIVTDSVSDLLLASEPAAVANLAVERLPAERIHYCGNVMIDTLVDQLPAARALEMAARLGVAPRSYAVATLHRPANVDRSDRLRDVIEFLHRLACELPVLFPVHPRTDQMLDKLGLRELLARDARVRLLPPLGYREFVGLMADARLVVTDSGGVQDETTHLGIPCVTLRASTERPATVELGTNVLAGDNLDHALSICVSCSRTTSKRSRSIAGWDGRAAERVVDALMLLTRRTSPFAETALSPAHTTLTN